MSANHAVLGVVLAGGLSRRMGTDKAMLDYHGQTLLQHQVNILASLSSQVVVSGDYADFDCVPDSGDRCGPLGGLHAVCRRFPGRAMLVIPVDMPQLTPVLLQRLLQNRAVCHFEAQPLPAFFPESCRIQDALTEIFNQCERGFSLRRLHEALASQPLYDAGFEAMNINTPAEWVDFKKKYT
jgi:molybdopterin-guanine dinucleotide biosynthesis protein A